MCNKKTNMRCGRCKMVFYCSKKHQSWDWKFHKPFCDLNCWYKMNIHSIEDKGELDLIKKDYCEMWIERFRMTLHRGDSRFIWRKDDERLPIIKKPSPSFISDNSLELIIQMK